MMVLHAISYAIEYGHRLIARQGGVLSVDLTADFILQGLNHCFIIVLEFFLELFCSLDLVPLLDICAGKQNADTEEQDCIVHNAPYTVWNDPFYRCGCEKTGRRRDRKSPPADWSCPEHCPLKSG